MTITYEQGYIDTDSTFANNSDHLVPSQKAVKTAIDNLSSTQTYMFANTSSDISTYYDAVVVSDYTTGTLGDILTTGVSTTPTLLGVFATELGYPGITSIPVGTITVHYDTEKVAGSNNYYTYAEIYTRTSGGTETLLATTDVSNSSAQNTQLNITVSAFTSTVTTISATDRIVVKVYGVMLSSTASIHLYFDDATSARIQLPQPLPISGSGLTQAQVLARLSIGF